MNWAVGQVLETVKEHGIDEETMVIFLSDHGPHLEMCIEGGSTGQFKGRA